MMRNLGKMRWITLLLVLMVIPFVLPVVWGFGASLSTNQEITINPLRPPSGLHFDNYYRAWTDGSIGRYASNSLLVSLCSAALVALFACGLGYALAWLSFPGKKLVTGILAFVIILPVFAYMVALSRDVHAIGLTDTRQGLILATTCTFLAVPAFMLRSFFAGLPKELMDAARIDGAPEWRVFANVMLPLARPGVLTAVMFVFVWAWNDAVLPAVLLQTPSNFTLPYGIASMRPSDFRQDYVLIFAATMISTIPIVLMYLFLQRRFIAGLTSGAVK